MPPISEISILSQEHPLDAEEFEERYRHYLGRDLPEFHTAEEEDLTGPWPVNLAHGLTVLQAETFGIQRPTDPLLPPDHDTVFVLSRSNGRTYLVNSEGANYCRFVVPCRLDVRFE